MNATFIEALRPRIARQHLIVQSTLLFAVQDPNGRKRRLKAAAAICPSMAHGMASAEWLAVNANTVNVEHVFYRIDANCRHLQGDALAGKVVMTHPLWHFIAVSGGRPNPIGSCWSRRSAVFTG